MKTIFVALSFLFTVLTLHSQTTTHPKLVPVYQNYTQKNMSTGQTKEGSSVVGYQYGDKYIKNNRQSRKELRDIIKLEPLAYSQYKQANIYGKIGMPLLIVGLVTGIFGFKYAVGDNPTKVPLIAGATVAVAGLVFVNLARKLSLKCIKTFNAHATTDTGNTTDGNFGFKFGINYNPVMRRAYPAIVMNF